MSIKLQFSQTLLFTALFLSISATMAESFPLSSNNTSIVGSIQTVTSKYSDTLLDIARENHIGYSEIVLANPGVDPWLPGEGTPILLPTQYILPDTPREGIVLNLAEMRLYYYPASKTGNSATVHTYPISIGREGWETPIGITKITQKVADPAWHPPASIRAEHAAAGDPLPARVPPGPDNPLGQHALRLGIPGYLIHGTNKPYGVGMKVSHGCIRLYPEDIEQLFGNVSTGIRVQIVNQPYKTAWKDGELYMEVHHPDTKVGETKPDPWLQLESFDPMDGQSKMIEIDLGRAEDTITTGNGVPRVVSARSNIDSSPTID